MSRRTYEKLSSTENINDSHYEELNQKINQIGDQFWVYEVASQLVNINPIIDWYDWLDQVNLPKSYLVPCHEYCLVFLGGYTNPKTGRIKLSSRTKGTVLKNITKFFSLFYAHEKSFNKWTNFNFEHIQSILMNEVDNIRKSKSNNIDKELNAGFLFLREMHAILKLYSSDGKLISPFSQEELLLLTNTKDFSAAYRSSINLSFAQFSKSKKGEAIPNYISMKWIVFIINTYDSDLMKFTQLHYLLRRAFPHLVSTISLKQTFAAVMAVRSGSFIFHSGKRVEELEKKSKTFDQYSEKVFNKTIKIASYLNFLDENFQRSSDQDKLTLDFLSHLYAAIMLTNGARKSEVNRLQLSDFKEVTHRESEYKSYIHKTMKGLPTIRSISGYVHDLAKKVIDIGLVKRSDENISLFYTLPSKSRNDKYRDRGYFFNRSYQLFLNSLPENEARQIKDDLPSVRTHQGRHSFFGYALRIGDLNTYEAIRKHARHEFMSFMTGHYTEGKLSEQEKRSLEREYITEIVGRIVNKEEHGYFGPMLKTLEALITQYIDFIDGTSKAEVQELGERISHSIDRIKINEFGMCFPALKTLEKSMCWDKSTKTPQYDQGSTFFNCSGCIHYFGMKGFIQDIQRHAISISTMLETLPIISKELRKSYEIELKRAEKLLAEGTEK